MQILLKTGFLFQAKAKFADTEKGKNNNNNGAPLGMGKCVPVRLGHDIWSGRGYTGQGIYAV